MFKLPRFRKLNEYEKRDLKRKILISFAPRLIWAMIWLLYATCRHKFHIDKNIGEKNVIVAFWHGEMLMMPFLYRKIRKNPKIFVIISEHFDGEIIARVQSFFGFQLIRGSKSKGGARVLIQSINKLKDGFDTAITPDGPKGPYHSVADGIVAIAQKTNLDIVVFNAIPSRFWEFKSWDKFKIPKPFCKIDYYAMPPFSLDSKLGMQIAKEIVRKNMELNPKEVFK